MHGVVHMQKATRQEEPVIIEAHDPTGGVEVSELFAPRLADLNGITVCELANRMWESERTFPVIREALMRRYPTMKIVPYTETPFFDERLSLEELAKVADTVKSAGAQAAIIGNAG
jgi:hypothetical protein